MTAPELIQLMNSDYGFLPWPETLAVDAETYANVRDYLMKWYGFEHEVLLYRGPRFGILLKGVELLCPDAEPRQA